jgi:hypothetical protein
MEKKQALEIAKLIGDIINQHDRLNYNENFPKTAIQMNRRTNLMSEKIGKLRSILDSLFIREIDYKHHPERILYGMGNEVDKRRVYFKNRT